jgi:ribosomal protein L24E
MSTYSQHTGALARCAFCAKSLPILNGELQVWRDTTGQFFCNEFCADDAEEARFHSYRKAYSKASELHAPSRGGRLSPD